MSQIIVLKLCSTHGYILGGIQISTAEFYIYPFQRSGSLFLEIWMLKYLSRFLLLTECLPRILDFCFCQYLCRMIWNQGWWTHRQAKKIISMHPFSLAVDSRLIRLHDFCYPPSTISCFCESHRKLAFDENYSHSLAYNIILHVFEELRESLISDRQCFFSGVKNCLIWKFLTFTLALKNMLSF